MSLEHDVEGYRGPLSTSISKTVTGQIVGRALAEGNVAVLFMASDPGASRSGVPGTLGVIQKPVLDLDFVQAITTSRTKGAARIGPSRQPASWNFPHSSKGHRDFRKRRIHFANLLRASASRKRSKRHSRPHKYSGRYIADCSHSIIRHYEIKTYFLRRGLTAP